MNTAHSLPSSEKRTNYDHKIDLMVGLMEVNPLAVTAVSRQSGSLPQWFSGPCSI